MSDSITNIPLEFTIARLPTPETAVISLEGEGSDEEQGSASEHSEEVTTAATPPAVVEEASTNVPAGNQPRPANQFVITVGPSSRTFTVDINDLRRESVLFRDARLITSIELRNEPEEAVELIWQWFSDTLGDPPLSEEERVLYREAARIARQLRIQECESQLLVIAQKVTATLEQVLTEQVTTGRLWTPQQVTEYVTLEMEGYMARSTNVGGEDDGESEGSHLDELLQALDEFEATENM